MGIKIPKKVASVLKFVFKIALSAAALFFVFKKIDFEEFKTSMLSVNIGWFVAALLMFNLSKAIAAIRLKTYYGSQGLELSHRYNFHLYYVGMFYNLFLPGSVGGDAYKIYLLKQNAEIRTKNLISSTLLDRLSGLVLLLFEATILFQYSSFENADYPWVKTLFLALGILAIPAWYLVKKFFFNEGFLSVFVKTSFLSFWVQVGQVLTAYFLLLAIGLDGSWFDYLSLFMVSSVVAVLPFTVGGVGAREIVFLYGYEFMNVVKPLAITFTILFFFVTAITSFCGFFLSFNIDKVGKAQNEGKD